MKKIAVIVAFIFCACGSSQTWYEERIANWCDKEWECQGDPTYHNDPDFVINMAVLHQAFIEARSEITVCPDPATEWKSSCEIAECMEGDCDTYAIWLWRKLRNRGWPDNVNGMMIVHIPSMPAEYQYHLVNAIKDRGGFIYCDVMGIIGPSPGVLNDLIFRKVIWFNLFEYREF